MNEILLWIIIGLTIAAIFTVALLVNPPQSMKDAVKKYGKWVILIIIVISLFFAIRLFIRSYIKNGTPKILGLDVGLELKRLKEVLKRNFLIRKKATEKIDEDLKLKPDLEKSIEDFFHKYTHP